MSFKRGMAFFAQYRYRKDINGKSCAKCGMSAPNVKCRAIDKCWTQGFHRKSDGDVLFIGCINDHILKTKNIVIQYNVVTSSAKYVVCRDLLDAMDIDANPQISILRNRGKSLAHVFGILHFIAGSDDIPYMRHITKLQCCNALLNYMDFIFPPDMDIHI